MCFSCGAFKRMAPKKHHPYLTTCNCVNHQIWLTIQCCRYKKCFERTLECGSEHQHNKACTSCNKFWVIREFEEDVAYIKNVHCMLEFAQRHQGWTINDWYRVIFSYETKIN